MSEIINGKQIVTFSGKIEKEVYSSTNYMVYGVTVNKAKYPFIKQNFYKNVSIVGDIGSLDIGETYTIKAYESEGKNGVSYNVVSLVAEKPSTDFGKLAFLETVLTSTQAHTLLQTYPDIIEMVIQGRDEEIDLSKLKGITENNFGRIQEKIVSNFALLPLCDEFLNLIPISTLKKLNTFYSSVTKIKENMHKTPYHCLCDLSGVGFKTADALLLTMEKKILEKKNSNQEYPFNFSEKLENSSQRCLACMEYCLQENQINGNTYIKLSDLKNHVATVAKNASSHFDENIKDKRFYYNPVDDVIGLKSDYEIEKYIITSILEANKNPILWDFDLTKYTKLGEFNLTEKQRSTSAVLCKSNVVVLNGAAGSGKSSSVKSLLEMLKDNYKSSILMCPTAKAAKVLKGYTQQEASTIHRGLHFGGKNDGSSEMLWGYNKDCKLPYDIVIIDETSMVDIYLMKHLIDAIDFDRTKLLLVGDAYQLPSVGAGNVFFDIINSKTVPIVTLDEIFRYSEGGLIKVATDTRNSKPFLPNKLKPATPLSFGNSYYFISMPQEQGIPYLLKMYSKLLQNNNIEDIMVLVSQNKGKYGTREVNKAIQNLINPSKEKIVISVTEGNSEYDIEYRQNDIIMQTVNDYKSIVCDENGYYEIKGGKPSEITLIANGESGKITKILSNGIVVKYDYCYIFRAKSDLRNLTLGYCITCHKSQGSGSKYVIMFTPQSHVFMLNSNLLYVAQTRAKEKCFHIGNPITVNTAIKKKQNLDRKTFMPLIIKKIKKGEII